MPSTTTSPPTTLSTSTVIEPVTLSGSINISVTNASFFVADTQVVVSVRLALATIMNVSADFISITLRAMRRFFGSQQSSAEKYSLAVVYVVTFPWVLSDKALVAKAAIIRSTPLQISALLEAEVNSPPGTALYKVAVLEVSPPRIEGSVRAMPTEQPGGVVFDYNSARRAAKHSAIFLGLVLLLTP